MEQMMKRLSPYYSTESGALYLGRCEEVLKTSTFNKFRGKCQLIFTSPPFPLARPKKYDNHAEEAYIKWLASYATLFKKFLKPDGSIVLEIGSSWIPNKPVMSTAAIEALLTFKKKGKLKLSQEIVWYNPARLPGPTEWVNVERVRLKDAFTRIWWMSPSERPKANNLNVLKPYSRSMKKLLSTQTYNAGLRPSEHRIGKASFLKDHGGAIPANVMDETEVPNLVKLGNTSYSREYLDYCEKHRIERHPARMPPRLAAFFIKLLTEPGDLVLDPFAGSNTTGAAAEELDRRCISIEMTESYAEGSKAFFKSLVEKSCPPRIAAE
jgi:site-specific DNA-methyltransferase (cytosine-N4-specific)